MKPTPGWSAKGPKNAFAERLSQLTGISHAEVLARLRALFLAGIGPPRAQPLSDTTQALYYIAFLSSETHLAAAQSAETFGNFVLSEAGLSGISSDPGTPSAVAEASLKSLQKLLPPLMTSPLRVILAHTIRALADRRPLELIHLQATLPPYEQFTIKLRPDNSAPISLSYGPSILAKKLRQKSDFYPMVMQRTLPGEVVAKLSVLATPDEILSRRMADEPDVVQA